ncbi:MAG: peptidylprolyl isomerase [Erythrobacter sp.]|uniref:peptidylprolyl isomerase n=1 Tax=Erythrobacter sp. TaxID=1042 RepID=UPI00260AF7D4|nr:peptidylprolyl isomerase [Erythrobacter sp.]MDJ0979728.1 peptidylprolyl isomerase [Erythrobacter sp.]
MKEVVLTAAALMIAFPAFAQDEVATAAPSPAEIIKTAPQGDWSVIAPEDLLVMTLAPDADGNERKVIIQLMPPPFSQGWVENIRTLARAQWYDGISVNRVQDNYVVQWGDPNYDNPESGGNAKPLPDTLRTMREGEYVAVQNGWGDITELSEALERGAILNASDAPRAPRQSGAEKRSFEAYAEYAGFLKGWPVGFGSAYTATAGEIVIPKAVAERLIADLEIVADLPVFGALSADEAEAARRVAENALTSVWPVHCYGMVGVGRNYSPDTGTGAELYTVIGHAPRHLDRNIALVGRIIDGMEHLSSLPRGSGALGFYTAEEADKRTPILSIRVASDLPEGARPQFEYLSTESGTFARYAEARANRRDPFFIVPAGGADICNIPVPVRAIEDADKE